MTKCPSQATWSHRGPMLPKSLLVNPGLFLSAIAGRLRNFNFFCFTQDHLSCLIKLPLRRAIVFSSFIQAFRFCQILFSIESMLIILMFFWSNLCNIFFRLYGSENVVYNVHSLIHIPDDAKSHGPLDAFFQLFIRYFPWAVKTACKEEAPSP